MMNPRTAWACVSMSVALSCSACGTDAVPDPVPAALHSIEGGAEDAFDQALASNFVAVSSDASSIRSQWTVFRPEIVTAGLPEATALEVDAALDGLDAAVAAPVSPAAVARAANAVSAPMDVLFAVYGPPTPTAIMELDYLGRELLLDALSGDFARATSDFSALEAQWTATRASVTGAGGAAEATQFDVIADALRAAITSADATALEAHAREELNAVDALEAVFVRAADAAD